MLKTRSSTGVFKGGLPIYIFSAFYRQYLSTPTNGESFVDHARPYDSGRCLQIVLQCGSGIPKHSRISCTQVQLKIT